VPQSILQRDRVLDRLPHPLSDAALEDLLFTSKAELEAQDRTTLTVSVTPDRLDLLSEGGLGLYLAGATEAAKGLLRPKVVEGPGPAPTVRVEESVRAIRPVLSAMLVTAPTDGGLDEGLLAEAVRFQELIHATVGRGRKAASLGIYPYERLVPPFRYALDPMSGVRFVPLEGSEEVTADAFFHDHPMAQQYGAYGRARESCLTLRDSRGTILSLPPILNSRTGGEARVGDRRLLLESTGTGERPVRESLGLLYLVFASRGWSVAPVAIEGGSAPSDGRGVFADRSVELPTNTLRDVSGMVYPAGEVEARLSRLRLGGHVHAGGWRVEVPPWRPDLLTAVDLAEDVILAQAIRPEDGLLPPSFGRGRRRRFTTFRRRFSNSLLGLGFSVPFTTVLVGEATVQRLAGAHPIRLSHPPSAEWAYVRDRLLLSHLEVLARNTRHGYPQRFGEVAPVVVVDPAAEPGAQTRYHVGAMIASETAGFADAAALVDYLLRLVDILPVREPIELPGTVPGRAARARIAGEPVAEMGEIHPSILTDLGVPVPVAWAEVDLTALFPLVGRRDTDL
jgi:phenylalanyl-tRNA synthetase beta chain